MATRRSRGTAKDHVNRSTRRSFAAQLRQRERSRLAKLRELAKVKGGVLSAADLQESVAQLAAAERTERGTTDDARRQMRHDADECECCDDLLRSHYRWRWIWAGTIALLRASDQRALQLLRSKLERSTLAARSGFAIIPAPSGSPVPLVAAEPLQLIPGFDDPVPSDTILERSRVFATGPAGVSLRGHGQPSPSLLMSIAYRGLHAALTDEAAPRQPGNATQHQLCARVRASATAKSLTSPTDRAWAVVADKFGYSDLDSAKRVAARVGANWRARLKDLRFRETWQMQALAILSSAVPEAKKRRAQRRRPKGIG
jgi:hypothetical protein